MINTGHAIALDYLRFFCQHSGKSRLLEGSYTLIFDIGKTTKKVLLFDPLYNVVEERTESFRENLDDDGFACDDIPGVATWVKKTTGEFLRTNKRIGSLNVSAYGASLVHLDRHGQLAAPFYNYLKPFPNPVRNKFNETYNASDDIPLATASPMLGMLNSGLQLFWLKHEKPELFAFIDASLHLPQYLSFLLTRKIFADITSVGCHTMLCDFEKKDYHQWVLTEGLQRLFPMVTLPDHAVMTGLSGRSLRIGIGVHDSSASLMPYLATMKERFMLLSTGTWNIAFNPFNHDLLTRDELRQDCLCYLTCQGNPVKASRIFLGHEHDLQVKAIAEAFAIDPGFYRKIKFDSVIDDRLSVDSKRIIFPLGMEGTGPLPELKSGKTSWDAFASPQEAYHAMIRQLARWQLVSLDLIDPAHQVPNLIVVGGFTHNPVFLECLKRMAPHLGVYVSDHPHAAALGAAWLVNDPLTYSQKDRLLNILAV